MSIQWTAEEDNPMDQIGNQQPAGEAKIQEVVVSRIQIGKEFQNRKKNQ